jgi:hypothetical protein
VAVEPTEGTMGSVVRAVGGRYGFEGGVHRVGLEVGFVCLVQSTRAMVWTVSSWCTRSGLVVGPCSPLSQSEHGLNIYIYIYRERERERERERVYYLRNSVAGWCN